jgi:hypothetical protein
MDLNLNVPSIESIRGDKSRPITRVHRVPSSRESSPTRQHPIMAKELLATKNEITPKMVLFLYIISMLTCADNIHVRFTGYREVLYGKEDQKIS